MENNNKKNIIFTKEVMPETERHLGVQAYKSIVEKMTDTFIAKNHDYGDSFAESVRELGPIAGFTPIMHKFNRLKNLVKGNIPMVEDETFENTLLDMANYCIMFKMELDKLRDL